MPPGRASTLPAELLSLIFSHLSQPDVLAVAAVCAWWRANALHAPSYYRAWTFIFPRLAMPAIWRRLDSESLLALRRVVSESAFGNYALGLRVVVEFDQAPDSPTAYDIVDVGPGGFPDRHVAVGDHDYDSALYLNKAEFHRNVLPELRSAVARCVVLSLDFDHEAGSELVDGLSGPAPLLRSLTTNARMPALSMAPQAQFSADFLAASAPRLTEVTMLSADLLVPSSPPFPAVRTLFIHRHGAELRFDDIARVFPNLRCLTVEVQLADFHVVMSGRSRPERSSLIRQLHELHFGPRDHCGMAQILHSNLDDAKQVPYIECRTDVLNVFAPLLKLKGAVSLNLFEHLRREDDDDSEDDDEFPASSYYRSVSDRSRFSQLCAELRSGDYVRVVDADVAFIHIFNLLSAGCTQSVTELTIDDRHLRTFMTTCGECMPSLTTLRITLVLWADPHPSQGDAALDMWQRTIQSGSLLGASGEGGPPRGDVWLEWLFLDTLELRATRAHTVVSRFLLFALARTFTHSRLRLTLSNGLALAPDAQGADVAALFSCIAYADTRFYPELDFVVRAEKLIQAARIAGKSFH